MSKSQQDPRALPIIRERIAATLGAMVHSGFGQPQGELITLGDVTIDGVRVLENGETAAGKGAKCTVKVYTPVTDICCNLAGNAHGGYLGWLVDVASSLPLLALSSPGSWTYSGVSTNINMYYIAGAPEGTQLEVVSTVIQQGKRTATVEARIYEAGTEKLIAVGTHVKADTPPRLEAKL